MHTIHIYNNRCQFIDADQVKFLTAWKLYHAGITPYKDRHFRETTNRKNEASGDPRRMPLTVELVTPPPICTFGLGMLHGIVTKILGPKNVKVIDKRLKPAKVYDWEFNFPHTFYPKQSEAVNSFLNSWMGKGVLHCACSSGKTPMAGAITATLGVPTAIFVNSAQLLRQLRKEFEKFFETEVGILGDSEYEWQPITVVSVDTFIEYLHNPIDTPRNKVARMVHELTKLAIHDECHRATSDTWNECAMALECYYTLGLSATPTKGCAARDNRLLSMCGHVLAKITDEDLQAVERNAPTYVISIPCSSPRHLFDSDKPSWILDKPLLTNNITRNDIIAEVAKTCENAGLRTLIPVDFSTHVDQIQEALKKFRVRSVAVTGKMKVIQRNAVIQQLKELDISTIVSTRVMDTGIDIPELAVVIDAGKKSDAVTTEQTKGRIKRKKPGDIYNVGFYIVIADTTHGALIGRHKKIIKTLQNDTTCTFHTVQSITELRQLISNILGVHANA